MKKIFKLLVKLFLVGLLIVLSIPSYIAYQLETSIDDVLSEEQQELLFTSIDETEDLPEHFYLTVEKYYPDIFTTTFWVASFSTLMGQKNRKFCPCHSIYLPYFPGEPLKNIEKFPFNQKIGFQRQVVSLELEERYSQKKCFAFNMNISDFGNNTHGVKEAAKTFYQKDLVDLTEREIIALMFIQKAPGMYNPIQNREKLDKVVDRFMDL